MIVGVIKDNSFTKSVVQEAESFGFKSIRVAQTQEAAMQLIRQKTFDLLIVDPHLTKNEHVEDGIEVIAEVRRIEQERKIARPCYILLLTATPPPPADGGLQERARNAGADDCLSTRTRGNWLANLATKIKGAIETISSNAPKQ